MCFIPKKYKLLKQKTNHLVNLSTNLKLLVKGAWQKNKALTVFLKTVSAENFKKAMTYIFKALFAVAAKHASLKASV